MREKHIPVVVEMFGRWGLRRGSEVAHVLMTNPVESLVARAESLLEGDEKVRMVKLTITIFEEKK